MTGGDAGLRLAAGRVVAADRMPYLRVALFAMIPVLTSAVPTCAVDRRWRMYANPAFVLAHTVDEVAGLWLHEAGHLLRDHAGRWDALAGRPERHPLWNIAGDAVINHGLREAGVTLPGGVVHWHTIPGAHDNMLTEQLYRLLLDQSAADSSGSSGHSGLGAEVWRDCGSGSGGVDRPWEVPGESDEADGSVSAGRADMIRRRVAEEIRAHERAFGDVPAHLLRFADDQLTVRVDWRRELRSVTSRTRAAVTGARDYTFGRPARRAAATPGIVLPALRAPRPPRMDIVIDTSGSMNAAHLGQVLAELRDIVRIMRAGNVRVLCCDACSSEPRRARRVEDVVLTGGGGTDMRVGLHAAASLRPRADIVVIATDGDTPWPDVPPPGNPRARYVTLLVDGPRPGVPAWMHGIVIG